MPPDETFKADVGLTGSGERRYIELRFKGPVDGCTCPLCEDARTNRLTVVAIDPPGAPVVTRSEMPADSGAFAEKPRRAPFPNPEPLAYCPKW